MIPRQRKRCPCCFFFFAPGTLHAWREMRVGLWQEPKFKRLVVLTHQTVSKGIA
jgi:hypothetical protein